MGADGRERERERFEMIELGERERDLFLRYEDGGN